MDKKSDYIIAIGSSAGGLNALKLFFDFTPSDQVSYVLLSHLSVHYKSELKEILERHSPIRILEAADGMPVEKNTIYLLPAKMMMVIENGKLWLMSRSEATPYPNWAVNIFLESLAKEKKDNSIAVILSGSGTDGVLGIAAVKTAGGMVIVQDPDSCEHKSMPLSAINSGNADFVLLPDPMPAVIQDYIDSKLLVEKMK